MKKNIIYIIATIFIFSNCVDEIKINTNDFNQKLIVEGSISNEPGPYKIQLTYSLPYTETVVNPSIGGAQVTLFEVGGVSVPMKETTQGNYRTDSTALVGKVGKSYFVKIRLPNGRIFESKPEKILPPIPIDTFKVSFQPGYKTLTPFSLTVRTKDPEEKGNYYRWKWTHYEILELCRNTYTINDFGRFNYKQYCCEKCWAIEKCDGCIDIASDGLVNGKYIEQLVGRLPFESKNPYFIILEQHAISKENFDFWNVVSSQINNSGGIFDKAPAQVQGNFSNVADSTEQVLGYFSSIGISKKAIYVPRDVPYQPNENVPPANFTETFLPDCFRCAGAFRTPIKPFGWR
jgi:Domain of unknown function (DUF4249)